MSGLIGMQSIGVVQNATDCRCHTATDSSCHLKLHEWLLWHYFKFRM
jgi:hypothetical protein